jgi:hypothetical protein
MESRLTAEAFAELNKRADELMAKYHDNKIKQQQINIAASLAARLTEKNKLAQLIGEASAEEAIDPELEAKLEAQYAANEQSLANCKTLIAELEAILTAAGAEVTLVSTEITAGSPDASEILSQQISAYRLVAEYILINLEDSTVKCSDEVIHSARSKLIETLTDSEVTAESSANEFKKNRLELTLTELSSSPLLPLILKAQFATKEQLQHEHFEPIVLKVQELAEAHLQTVMSYYLNGVKLLTDSAESKDSIKHDIKCLSEQLQKIKNDIAECTAMLKQNFSVLELLQQELDNNIQNLENQQRAKSAALAASASVTSIVPAADLVREDLFTSPASTGSSLASTDASLPQVAIIIASPPHSIWSPRRLRANATVPKVKTPRFASALAVINESPEETAEEGSKDGTASRASATLLLGITEAANRKSATAEVAAP